MKTSPDDCASEVLDVAPLIMRVVRAEMRSQRGPDLSVPQFRVLGFINRHPATSLSAVAEHVGQALPTMSNLVDSLVRRKLIAREFSTVDRRRMTLQLTSRGEQLLTTARQGTKDRLVQRLAVLAPEELAKVTEALRLLRPVFGSGPTEIEEPKE